LSEDIDARLSRLEKKLDKVLRALRPAPLDRESLSEAEAGAFLGVSPHSLRDWRSRGVGPPFIKAGRRVVYRRADLEAYQANLRIETQSVH
jgi:hypothetical protein